ncbi:peroxide stress protein YaaA [Lachnoanaerobaculum umeaense]|uniref:UPF0246 protein D4A81_11030 n=1 Tax=Lachnoanaerobaculum umeaense TaxID=617123 RepID=A0A385Q1Y9_9FIRM|nr:peroxide stress protein YaaA [Lachnoanaerobaculum umeaense]AYB00412.1 peroxide stress protein YaaA [Lachnoanaerobaculum umeaense]PZW99821.1 hypothetical protein C7439_10221 [Lachnoanaerobaculum umeaense]
MKIVVSPAKTMIENTDSYIGNSIPTYIDYSRMLLDEIRQKSYEEMKEIWKCNDKIANENFDRFKNMNLQGNLSPAIFSYQGIQYQYMAVNVMESSSLEYIRENLYILSGFFGILRTFDVVSPYRLEMQAKLEIGDCKNLYEFWGDKIYRKLFETGEVVINLASKEYSKIIESYLSKEDKFITCVFAEKKDGKIVQKATLAKMARGEMVNFLASNDIQNEEEIKKFDRLGFVFDKGLSNDNRYVFVLG